MPEVVVLMICGAVVLYNPSNDVYENIVSYLDSVDRLYVLDNSDVKNSVLLQRLEGNERIGYIDLQGNMGVAYALNRGAEAACRDGAQWILTMDQDSRAAPGMVDEMLKCAERHREKAVGLISPFHTHRFDREAVGKSECRDVMTAMTSGCLLHLEAYRKAGAFREEFFIDRIDIEYCLRLRKMGYRVMEAGLARLHHNVGELSRHRILNQFVYTSNHPPLRYYYVARNRLAVIREYFRDFPLYCLQEVRGQFAEIAKVIFFERAKKDKLFMIFRGVYDALCNRFGRLDA